MTVLADGVKWIWDQQRKHLRDSEGVLDIYHALEHMAALGKELFDDPASQRAWLDQAREMLLSQGWTGIDAFVETTLQSIASRTPQQQTAAHSLRDYLAPHQRHLHYAQRLANGQSIGSGQIEGACKNLIGRRLKANAARWRVRRVNRMAGLCSLIYSRQWETFWQTP